MNEFERRIIDDNEINWMREIATLNTKSDRTYIETQRLENRKKQLRVSTLNASQRLIGAYRCNDEFAAFIVHAIDVWAFYHRKQYGFTVNDLLDLHDLHDVNTAEYFQTQFASWIDSLAQESVNDPDWSWDVFFYNDIIQLTNKNLVLGILSYSDKDVRISIPA